MNYEIQLDCTNVWRVLLNGVPTKSRFHHHQQAVEWVDGQRAKEERAYTERKGHLNAGKLPDIYGENLLNYPQDHLN